ncbi:hypothetical protein COT97_03355 [Candidatus Falkowbacteria bacterium CG10_big_fil_rev_8_21_14_0_10_39_11]|uniref:Tyrosine specific protein phosphatases domain-containing protein n=1 Tax=Candidatus Falkowbacteria bacterium CG10_big_fil_rev_8_21_14_0_10_39_11 TaxID=1974565 RepID=A0A2H0V4T1_9BACT|nr:MAG: hypothetical protein COT97_03355 [Candidatus Falkowbacteria bacterium CG10_big_fil_rev_8_21_14_0_10_39_11]
MDQHVRFKFNKINDQIYLGTNFCCQMHFDQSLLKKGITADISMESERLDQPRGVKAFLWLPTRDHTAPAMDKLMVGVKTIAEMLNQGLKVYIHCKNGHGRAPTMTAAYLIYSGLSVPVAISLIKKKRPEVHLEKVQLDRLKQFAKRNKKAE